jgi:prepilin-type N-terminal cleavage/methylation domain-containing protein
MILKPRYSLRYLEKRRMQFSRPSGFSLVEVMVAVAIIGIITAIAVVESGKAYNRDKLNEATLLLRSWLLEISNKPDTIGQSCAITISTGTISTGAQIASVLPVTCSSSPTLLLPGRSSGQSFNVGASQTTWSFTRRNAINSANDVIIKFSINGFTSLRCVRVQAISGLLRLGYNDATSDVTATCNNWSTI